MRLKYDFHLHSCLSPCGDNDMTPYNLVNMAKLMDVKVLGLVENYSYIVCPDCGKVIRPYGESKIESLAASYGTNVLAQLPINPDLAAQCDKGVIELFEGDYMERACNFIEKNA